jgi:flagellar hook-basal body complex protein FliE
MDAINTDILSSQYNRIIPNNDSTKKPLVGSFGEFLKNSINEVNELQKEANTATQKLATGEEKDIHNTMIALQKASVSFEFIVQIQNKIMTAYDELKRMQI